MEHSVESDAQLELVVALMTVHICSVLAKNGPLVVGD